MAIYNIKEEKLQQMLAKLTKNRKYMLPKEKSAMLAFKKAAKEGLMTEKQFDFMVQIGRRVAVRKYNEMLSQPEWVSFIERVTRQLSTTGSATVMNPSESFCKVLSRKLNLPRNVTTEPIRDRNEKIIGFHFKYNT